MINPRKIINKNKEILKTDDPNIIRGADNADLDEIKAALKNDPDCINEADKDSGVTALHITACDGNYSIVDFLCDQPGIDISIRDNFDRPAYLCALMIGRQDIHDRIMRDSSERVCRKITLEDVAGNVTILKPEVPKGP